MQNRIEHECLCRRCFYDAELKQWQVPTFMGRLALQAGDVFCSFCGWHLGNDGWAEKTVVLNSDLQVVFRGVNDTEGECYFPADSGGECWSYPRFALIPLTDEVPDEQD